VDELGSGHAAIPDSYVPPGHPLYPGEDLSHWEYDPAASRAALDELGWRDEDRDGVREAHDVVEVSDEEPFEVTLLTSSGRELSQKAARMVRAQLADCGIRVIVESLPSWELFADGPEGPVFGRRFDLVETLWWSENPPACEHFLSSEVPQEGHWGGSNVTGYSNPGFDAACLAARRTLPGTATYERHHRRAQVIFSQDLPGFPLFVWPRVALARPTVEGFEVDPTAESDLWGLETLDVERGTAPP
jgi:peptide/nickel transport system substrate-binding protein